MKTKKILFALFLLALACSKDEDPTPSELSMYVKRFVDEGNTRGFTNDVSKLKINFVTETNPSGYCGYGESSPQPHVQIKQSDGCWKQRTDTDKEILVFHELGHAILQRYHLNDTLPNGDYKSMMFAGDQFGVYNEHMPEKRQYYIDELFNASIAAPSWATAKKNRTVILDDSIALPNAWRFQNYNKPEDVGSVNNQYYTSAAHSLAIRSSPGTATNNFSYWTYSFTPNQIPVGSKLVLKVKVKTDLSIGNGADIALRGDGVSDHGIFFVTTQGTLSIAGKKEFTEYSVKLNYYPADIQTINIYLIAEGNNTGNIYFDDVKLINYR